MTVLSAHAMLNTNVGQTKHASSPKSRSVCKRLLREPADLTRVKATTDEKDIFEERSQDSESNDCNSLDSHLRFQRPAQALAEVYASSVALDKFVRDFIGPGTRCESDRFDLAV
jgi:catalase (peroxidase I)